jgi:hypothetical protein
MLFGCIIGWGILSPIAHFSGWAPGPVNDWKTGSKGWILWISLGIMISESIVSLIIVLIKQIIVIVRQRHPDVLHQSNIDQEEGLLIDEPFRNDDGWGDNEEIEEIVVTKPDMPQEQQVPLYITIIGLLASIVLCVGMVYIVFGDEVMPVWMTLISIVFAMFLSILGVRALGETDLNPVSGIGKFSQFNCWRYCGSRCTTSGRFNARFKNWLLIECITKSTILWTIDWITSKFVCCNGCLFIIHHSVYYTGSRVSCSYFAGMVRYGTIGQWSIFTSSCHGISYCILDYFCGVGTTQGNRGT